MKKSEVIFGLLRIPMDMLAVMAALLLSYRLREANIDLIPKVQLLDAANTLPSLPEYLQTFVWPSLLVFVVIGACVGLYALRTTLSSWNEAGRIILACLLWLVAVMAWYFFVRKQLFYSRVLLMHATFFLVVLVAFGRTAVILLQRAFLSIGIGTRLVVSLGTLKAPVGAQHTLTKDIRYRYLGHIEDIESLKRLEHKHHLDLVLQTDPNPKSDETISLINYCRSHHIGYGFLPPVLADVPHLLRVERLGLVPLVRFQPTPLDGWGRVGKRLFDIIVSLALLYALSPLLLLIMIAVLLESGFPIFYISKRVGQHAHKKVKVLKFRSMVKNADALKPELLKQNHRQDGPLFKMKNDPRITKVGRVLRRFSLDELPQLINVLFGQMSLVGPRPHLPEEVEKYSLEQRRVFTVKPGITGLAQISGRSDLKFEEEVHLDLQYIEEWSVLLDIWVLWRTIFVIVDRKGAD